MSLSSEIILALTEALESTINLALQQDQTSLKKLGRLQGKIICFEFTDLEISLYLLPHQQGIQIHYLHDQSADTTLRGSTLAFMNMSLGDSTQSLFSGEVRITGDIELGQHFKAIIDQLDLDWEEWLSRYTGDLIAHKAGNIFKDLNSWRVEAINTLKLNSREYLQDEGLLTPFSSELSEFAAEISQLRDQSARLEARLSRLQKQIETNV